MENVRTTISIENIPAAMRELAHWVFWKKQFENGRWAKIPYQINGKRAESDNPNSWTTFSNVLKCFDVAKYDGIGFQFAGSGLVGIDIDDCISNGQISSQAQEIIDLCSSYTEESPSGTGIHIIVRGTTSSDMNKRADIKFEMYSHKHYFTVTGHKLTEHDVEPRQAAVDQLYIRFANKGTTVANLSAAAQTPHRTDQSDQEILERAFKSKRGPEIKALFDGDVSRYGNDDSRADLALCGYLAFWLDKDFRRIDEAFRSSKLYREKWDRADYKALTIGRAIAGCRQSRGTLPIRS